MYRFKLKKKSFHNDFIAGEIEEKNKKYGQKSEK